MKHACLTVTYHDTTIYRSFTLPKRDFINLLPGHQSIFTFLQFLPKVVYDSYGR